MATKNSTQYQDPNSLVNPRFQPTHELYGRIRFARCNYNQGASGGAAGDIQRLVFIESGPVRLILPLCRFAVSAFGGTGITLDLGHEAYKKSDGTTVAQNLTAFDSGFDASTGGTWVPTGTVGGDETFLIDTQDGVSIVSSVQGGAIPANATIDGYLVFVVD